MNLDPISILTVAGAIARATGLSDLIGKKLEGTKAGVVAGRVVDVARAVTGIAQPEAALHAVESNPELQAQLRMRLIDMYEAEIRVEAEDRASARAREVQIVTADGAPMFVKLVPSMLALGVVGMSFALFMTMIFAPMDAAGEKIVIYVLGVLSAALSQVLSYFFGSTKGSESKNTTIEAMAKKVHP